MRKEIDVKKIRQEMQNLVEKMKVGLRKAREETAIIAKRGEKELVRLSKIGKAEMDIWGLNLQKNRLFQQLGKNIYQLKIHEKFTDENLKKICIKINCVEKDLRAKRKSISKSLKPKTK